MMKLSGLMTKEDALKDTPPKLTVHWLKACMLRPKDEKAVAFLQALGDQKLTGNVRLLSIWKVQKNSFVPVGAALVTKKKIIFKNKEAQTLT